MIPATCAVASASPSGSSRSRRAVSAPIRTSARATARRREGSLPPTSTIRTAPVSSTCESSLISPLGNPSRSAVELVELGGEPVGKIVLAHMRPDRVEPAAALRHGHLERLVNGFGLRGDIGGIDLERPGAELFADAGGFG